MPRENRVHRIYDCYAAERGQAPSPQILRKSKSYTFQKTFTGNTPEYLVASRYIPT
ncbi:hypothetical protein [Pseudomonas fluorescens]